MISLKEFMEIVDYRITEGSDYQWQCFGPTAYCLDSWNGEQDGHTVSIIFDTRDQTVYQAMVYDYKNIRAYRMTNPDYRSEFDAECKDRDILDMAWEDDEGNPIKFVDLDIEGDFIEKARAIVNEENYDTRVQVQIVLPDDELYTMMKLAHERDITLNQLVEIALKEAIDQHHMLNDEPRAEYDFSQAQPASIKRKTKSKK